MEALNKKALLHIFLGVIIVQSLFLLAYSANFLLAETTTSDPLTIQFIDIPSSPLSENQTIYAQTNNMFGNIEFKVIPGIGGVAYTPYPGTLVLGFTDKYQFIWPTADFTDGIYDVRAMTSDGMNTADAYINNIQVQNEIMEETTTTAPTVEITVANSGDRKNFQGTSNMALESIMFHFDNLNDSTNSIQMPGTPLTSDLMNWTLNLNEGYLTDDVSYNFYAIGLYEETSYKSMNYIFIPKNNEDMTSGDGSDDTTMPDDTQDDPVDTTTIPLTLTFLEQFKSPLFGDQKISISSNQEIFNCVFKIYGPRYAEFPAIKDGPINCYIILHTKNFPNGDYTIKAVAGNNIEITDTRLDIKIENLEESSITETPPEIKTYPITETQPATETYPPTETPIVDKVYHIINTTPTTSDDPVYPEKPTLELPLECIERNLLTPEECRKYLLIPSECREQNILNLEACKRFMFEKYDEKESIPVEKFPIECEIANAKTIEECRKIMQETYLPKECKDEGLENEQECETYLRQKHMPEECLEADAKSRQECNEIMFEELGSPECIVAGIEDEKECAEFIFNKYAPTVSCDNIEDWQCKDFIKERHLGNIVAKQIIYNKINEKKEEITGKSMKAEDQRMEVIQEEKMYPIVKKNIGIKIIATNESIVLDEENNLIQTAPIAFMIDSDEDGLPDNMEKRFGTDPFKADTDEDDYNDGEEIKNGHNPLGEGKFEKTLAPIEKAIMENRPLGHPTIEGEEVENFSVENISNAKNAQGNLIEGYVLSGKTKPNSVATLYIYSDLPIVVTVDANQYGNWNYQLDQSLVDGEHEVYIAINDNTGKVLEKSKPLNFFVKEASAVSVKDFVSVAKASSKEPKESEVSIYYYLLITLLMAIAGIFLFLAVIINRKRNRTLQ